MNLIRNSFDWPDLSKIHDEFDRLFSGTNRYPGLRSVPRGTFLPFNVHESDEDFLITVEVPGLDTEKLSLQLEGGVLTIEGKRELSLQDGESTIHRRERGHGSFRRTLSLDNSIDPDSTEAEYQDGILAIRVAKAATAKPRKIQIQ